MDVSISVMRSVLFWSFLFTILILNSACHEKKVEIKPSYVIGKDSMVQMIAEMHLIESSLGVRVFEEKKLVNLRALLKSKVFKNYGVSKDRFEKSYMYYGQKSEVIDSIYADVISEITKRQAEKLKK